MFTAKLDRSQHCVWHMFLLKKFFYKRCVHGCIRLNACLSDISSILGSERFSKAEHVVGVIHGSHIIK